LAAECTPDRIRRLAKQRIRVETVVSADDAETRGRLRVAVCEERRGAGGEIARHGAVGYSVGSKSSASELMQ
jgi:hypothetical protein